MCFRAAYRSGPAATWSNLRYRDTRRIARRADLAYDATQKYLEALP